MIYDITSDEKRQLWRIARWRAELSFDPTKASIKTYAIQKYRSYAFIERRKLQPVHVPAQAKFRAYHHYGQSGPQGEEQTIEPLLPPTFRAVEDAEHNRLGLLTLAIADLLGRHQQVAQFTADGMTQKEIAEQLGVSSARVHQILNEAVVQMQQFCKKFQGIEKLISQSPSSCGCGNPLSVTARRRGKQFCQGCAAKKGHVKRKAGNVQAR